MNAKQPALPLGQPEKTNSHARRLNVFALLLLLILVLVSADLDAQTAQWIRQQGTGGISNGISSDAAGNTYAAGTISNPGLFDNIVIPCHASDVFLAKYDPNGGIIWAKVGGGDLLDQGNDIATDAAGNSYVVGAIQTNGLHPTAQFDDITLTGHGDYDWLIVKYDPNGNVLWAKNAGGTGGDMANGVGLDSTGNIYVCGLFSGTMTVDGITVTSSGLFDVFLAKYDANGTLLWLKRGGGTGSDIAHGIAIDVAGDVAIVGEFQNTALFDSHSVTSAGLGNAFIAKYDPAGNNLWVHSGGSTTSFATDPARAIAVDAANNFYIAGDYTGTATFDGLSVPNAGLRDVFVAKYGTNGAIQWLRHGGGPHAEEGHSIGVDRSGNSWVSGFLGSGPGVMFDNIPLPPRGNEYVFLAKYNPSGAVQYVKQYAAGLGQDIHVLNNGCLYFGGGASLASGGHEFDDISLVYVDRGGFAGEFCEPPAFTPSVVSEKMQGATIFEIALPLTGPAGIECRSGGIEGNHQVSLTFASPVTLTNASVTDGVGNVIGYSVGGSRVTVNLTGVANAQTIAITLSGVSDGTNTSEVIVPMSVLLGDTSGNGVVNGSDISQTKTQLGQPVTAANFRADVNANGTINGSDVSLVKSKAGTALP